jgi:hypothetical protein
MLSSYLTLTSEGGKCLDNPCNQILRLPLVLYIVSIFEVYIFFRKLILSFPPYLVARTQIGSELIYHLSGVDHVKNHITMPLPCLATECLYVTEEIVTILGVMLELLCTPAHPSQTPKPDTQARHPASAPPGTPGTTEPRAHFHLFINSMLMFSRKIFLIYFHFDLFSVLTCTNHQNEFHVRPLYFTSILSINQLIGQRAHSPPAV